MATGAVIGVDLSRLGVAFDEPASSKGPFLGPANSNNVIGRMGSLFVRPGIVRVGTPMNENISGILHYQQIGGNYRILAAGNNKWWFYDTSWHDISGGVALSGTLRPWSFAIWLQGGTQYIIGVNSSDQKEWNAGAAGVVAYTATAAAMPSSAAITSAANRVFVLTTAAGLQTLQWSSVNDRTTWPAAANNILVDGGDTVVTVKALTRTSIAIYKQHSQWLATATAGSDANAWQFSQVDRQPGPKGRGAVTDGPGFGTHLYFGYDGNLYLFDGVQSRVLFPFGRYIIGQFGPGFGTGAWVGDLDETSIVYDPIFQEVWIAVDLGSDGDPKHFLVYSFLNGQGYLASPPKRVWSLATYGPGTQTTAPPHASISGKTILVGSEDASAGTGVYSLSDGSADFDGNQAFTADVIAGFPPSDQGDIGEIGWVRAEPKTATLTVSVGADETYDGLPAPTSLGTITPTTKPPVLSASGGFIGKYGLVRLSGSGPGIIRKLELGYYPRHTAL